MHEETKTPCPDKLISGYMTGELSPDELKELLDWIKLDKANKQYFDQCCEIWITARASSKNPGYNVQKGLWMFRQKIRTETDKQIRIKHTGLIQTIIRYAAVFIVAFSLSGLLFYYLGRQQSVRSDNAVNELVVPMGSHSRITLSDGTEVTLNAGSTLKYNNLYGADEREVQLEGEGYFKVAKDASRPFIVKTPYLKIIALGTEFNVRAYPVDKTIEATLVEGLIKVEPSAGLNKGKTTVLKPNQKLTFFKEDSTLVDESLAGTNENTADPIHPLKVQKPSVSRLVKETVDVEPVVSWKENRWIFEKQCLSDIVVELERKYDVQINFESEKLKSFRFTGTIIAEPIEQVLEVMSISAPINFKLKGRIVTLYENKNFEELNKSLFNQHN
jgi:ferric-dicitrate binding protein FerR (iron transport regulator)